MPTEQSQAIFDQGVAGPGFAGPDRRAGPGGLQPDELAADRRGAGQAAGGHGRGRAAACRSAHDAARHVLLVKDVPACGYRVLKLGAGRPAAMHAASRPRATSSKAASTASSSTRPAAAITSIRDKELGRELVDPKAPFRLNQYRLRGRRQHGTRIVMNPNGPPPRLKITGSRQRAAFSGSGGRAWAR